MGTSQTVIPHIAICLACCHLRVRAFYQCRDKISPAFRNFVHQDSEDFELVIAKSFDPKFPGFFTKAIQLEFHLDPHFLGNIWLCATGMISIELGNLVKNRQQYVFPSLP